jgi:hypothetical protein
MRKLLQLLPFRADIFLFDREFFSRKMFYFYGICWQLSNKSNPDCPKKFFVCAKTFHGKVLSFLKLIINRAVIKNNSIKVYSSVPYFQATISVLIITTSLNSLWIFRKNFI